jgi:hypothetical protein
MLGTRESGRLKVTALNLFHPTASPLSKKLVFSYYDTTSKWRRKRERGRIFFTTAALLG